MLDIEMISLVFVNIISNICYSVLNPFLPIELKKRNVPLSLYGFIFAMYAFAVILGSAWVGKSLTIFGRKAILVTGLFSMAASLLGFSMLDSLSEQLVVPVALIFRMCQGLSSSCIQTTSYAIVPVLYSDKQQKYLGILETSISLGCIIGPVVGSVLYHYFRFAGTFQALSVAFLVFAVLLIFIVPKTVDKQDLHLMEWSQEDSELLNSNAPMITQRIKYLDIFKWRIFVLTAIVAFFSYFWYWFFEPILAIRLMEFGLSEFWIGMFYTIQAGGYIVGWISFTLIPDYFDKKVIITVSMFLTGTVTFLVGPSPLLPNSLLIMGIGNFFHGMFTSYFVIIPFPLMIETVSSRYPKQKLESSDISSGVFNSMLGLGQMLAPLYGSYMTDYYGYRFTCDTVGVMLIVYSLSYYWLWHNTVVKNEQTTDILLKQLN